MLSPASSSLPALLPTGAVPWEHPTKNPNQRRPSTNLGRKERTRSTWFCWAQLHLSTSPPPPCKRRQCSPWSLFQRAAGQRPPQSRLGSIHEASGTSHDPSRTLELPFHGDTLYAVSVFIMDESGPGFTLPGASSACRLNLWSPSSGTQLSGYAESPPNPSEGLHGQAHKVRRSERER